MNEVTLEKPTFDWDNASRRDGMVRFGPIIGCDVLELNDHYTEEDRKEVLASSLNRYVRLGEKDQGNASQLLASLDSAYIDQTYKIIDALLATDNNNFARLQQYGIDSNGGWVREQNMFWPYKKTLQNSIAGTFTSVNYCLCLLEKTNQIPDATKNADTALEIIRADWFPEFMRQVANAPQFFWSIPDPSHYRSERVSDIVELQLQDIARLTELELENMLYRAEAGVMISPAIKKFIEQEKVIKTDKDNEKIERTDALGTDWGKKTTSGCPVRHRHVGSKAIQETFTTDQIEAFEERKVICKTDAGYELFDFMKFAANFVADHLEALDKLLRAEVVPEVVQN